MDATKTDALERRLLAALACLRASLEERDATARSTHIHRLRQSIYAAHLIAAELRP